MASVFVRALLFVLLAVPLFTDSTRSFVRYLTADGIPLRWTEPEITLGVATESEPLALGDAMAAIDESIASWMAIDCDPPELRAVTDASATLDPDDARVSVVWFRDPEAWAERFSVTELARTIIIHRVQSGAIIDADIAVNLGGYAFSAATACSADEFDLQSVVTHEIGHLFGLDHSPEPDATMNRRTDPGDCELRTLADDDIAGLCATYDQPAVVEPEPSPEPLVERAEPDDAVEPESAISERADTGEPEGDDGCCAGADGGWLAAWAGLALMCARRARSRCRRGPRPFRARS